MKTEKQTIEVRTICADNGKWLRRRNEIENPHYTKMVYLGSGDSADNYIEVDESEYTAYVAAQEQRMKELAAEKEAAEAQEAAKDEITES